ncbi:MAG: shikimate dehydrogenase [Candidatus Thorarchaeota archaeon]
MKQFVLIGYPLGHSLSPLMHNAALLEMGLESDYRYDLQPTLEHRLQNCVKAIKDDSLSGANITIPYKSEILRHLHEVSEEASVIGSVNTLHRVGNDVTGFNTDVIGFLRSLREHSVTLRRKSAIVIGAGGAARAVTYALISEGLAHLDLVNRSLTKAEKLIASMKLRDSCEVRVWPSIGTEFEMEEPDLLINCTPVGMSGHSVLESPVKSELLHPEMTVMDLVYNPRTTKLIQEASHAGCTTIDGTGMLVHQGAEALEMWIGKKPPIETMRSAVIQALGG